MIKGERPGFRLYAAILLAAFIFLSGCARSPEAKKARFMAAGKQYMEAKDYSRAILQFRNAIKFGQKDPETYYQLALSYLASGNTSGAMAALRKAVEVSPSHIGAQTMLAKFMAATDRKEFIEEAAEKATAVLASSPGNADALDTLAVSEFKLGKQEDAEKHLEEVLAKFPARLASAVTLAKMRMARKDLRGAEEVLKNVAAQQPPSAIAFVALGDFYNLLGKFPESEQALRRALQIEEQNGAALLALAGLQLRTGYTADAESSLKALSRLPDKQYGPAYGLYLFQNGKCEQAVAEFSRLAKDDPNDRGARTRLVSAYVALNRISEANDVLTAALSKNTKDVEALLQRATLLLLDRKYAEARRDLAEVLHYRSTSAQAHVLLAKIYVAEGSPLRARLELSEAIRLDPQQLGARLELSRLLLAAKSAKAALEVLNAANAAQQQNPSFVSAKNWALIALGERAQARKDVNAILSHVRTPELLCQDALLKLGEKDYSGARAAALEAVGKNPEEVLGLTLLSATYRGQNQAQAGLLKVREHVAKYPQSARLQYFLGSELSSSGDLVGARRAFEAAKAANPKSVNADLALAELDVSERKLDAGRKRLMQILAAEPTNRTALLMFADLEMQAGSFSQAIGCYRKVLDGDAQNVLALNNIAYLLAEFGNQPDEALKYAQQAKEISPNNAQVEDTLGWVLYHKGMHSAAVKHLEAAVGMTGTPAQRYHLAMAYAKSGDSAKGRKTFEAALRADPNIPEAKQAQQIFR